ncbi:DgyrCDS5272 [Dimorphilus gyrociliatus]|uniref:DgyrCDS5272 n=1 Tax=Dimorphilus gyrociliatus TaxID=2664684 RepID=A0A7I8VJH4_9ANNE|nr:DgyrCDS5272 [Dimorphilus gyrociliatus]
MDRHRKRRLSPRRSRSPSKGTYRRSRSRSHDNIRNRRSRSPRRRSRDRKSGISSSRKSLKEIIKSGSYESFKVVRNSRQETRKKHTTMSFNERFSNSNKEKFVAQDNITIGIERNIQGNFPAVIPPFIDTSAVVVFRKRDDGDKPLCKRPEFKNDIEVEDEKRAGAIDPTSVVSSVIHSTGDGWKDSKRENRRRRFDVKLRRGNLPDFGKRRDKGRVESWQLNPDVVPKGRSYYEHDNRMDSNHSHRNNRGGMRSWQPRNNMKRRWNDSKVNTKDNDKWAHDKYGELEHDGDEESAAL